MTLARRLASATTQLTASNLLVRMLSLATMPILTRLVVPAAYGAAAVVGTVVALCAVLALAGMDISYSRTFHAGTHTTRGAVECFAWRYALGAAFVSSLLIGVAWVVWVADLFGLPRYLAIFIGLGVGASVACTMTQVRARLNDCYGRLSLATLAAGMLGAAVSVGIALWWRQDELGLILALLTTYLVPIALLRTPSLLRMARPSGLSREQKIGVLKIGIAAVVTAPMYWALSSLDRWFLLYFEDAASVGIYSIGYSVAIIGMVVSSALQAVWLPEAAREFERDSTEAQLQLGRLAEILVATLALVWLAVAAAGGDIVRLLAGPAFHSAADVIPLIAAGVFFYGVMQLASAGLVLMGKLHYAAWWWFAGAVLCVLLNWALVPGMGRVGAAAAQAIAFGFVGTGILISAQAVFPLRVRRARLALVVAGVAVLGSAMHPAWSSVPIQSLLWKAPVGVLVALLTLRVTTNQNLVALIRSLRASRPYGSP
jgi:O-antigen/teichoic acid export membrane protein